MKSILVVSRFINMRSRMTELPVVVIGAGPQGLAAAAHLVQRNLPVVVLEAGAHAGAAVAEWAHVRLFSPWPELVDNAARSLLAPTGWQDPGDGYPRGRDWVADYLTPLAAALGERVRCDQRVTGVTRQGRDLTVSSGRAQTPFVVHTVTADGRESRMLARAVIDAGGTWQTPNPAGADGHAAAGEHALGSRLRHDIPDSVDEYAGQHVVVVGAGHSASHAVIRLAELARRDRATKVTWLLRRKAGSGVFGGGAGDDLPERAALGRGARSAVESGAVELVRGFRVAEFVHGTRMSIVSEDGMRVDDVDQVFALTGFRPDFSYLSEMRTSTDAVLQAVRGIAAEIDPNIHSCGSVAATGARELVQPETDFYIVGAKSYGRAPTFLALTGYEQVRSVVAELAGDHDAAARNELVLPDTGVCGGAGDFGEGPASGSCCAPAPAQLIQLGGIGSR